MSNLPTQPKYTYTNLHPTRPTRKNIHSSPTTPNIRSTTPTHSHLPINVHHLNPPRIYLHSPPLTPTYPNKMSIHSHPLEIHLHLSIHTHKNCLSNPTHPKYSSTQHNPSPLTHKTVKKILQK